MILPLNPNQDVKRVMKRFGLHPDDIVKVSGTTKTHLVSEEPETLCRLYRLKLICTTGRQRDDCLRASED